MGILRRKITRVVANFSLNHILRRLTLNTIRLVKYSETLDIIHHQGQHSFYTVTFSVTYAAKLHEDEGVVQEHDALDESIVNKAEDLLFGKDSAVVNLFSQVSRIKSGWQFQVAPSVNEKLSDKTFEVLDHKCESLEEQIEVDCVNSYFQESSVARKNVAKRLFYHFKYRAILFFDDKVGVAQFTTSNASLD